MTATVVVRVAMGVTAVAGTEPGDDRASGTVVLLCEACGAVIVRAPSSPASASRRDQ